MARKNLIKDIREAVESGNDSEHSELYTDFEKWAKIKGFETDWPGIYPHIKGHGIEWTVCEDRWHHIYDQPKKYFREFVAKREEQIKRKLEQQRESETRQTYAKLCLELCQRYGDDYNHAIWIHDNKGIKISKGTVDRISINERRWACDQLHLEDWTGKRMSEINYPTGEDLKAIYEHFKDYAETGHTNLIRHIKARSKKGGWVRLSEGGSRSICHKCVAKNLTEILEHTEARKGKWFVDHVWNDNELRNNKGERWFCPLCEPTSLKVGRKTITIGKTEYKTAKDRDWSTVECFVYRSDKDDYATCRAEEANAVGGSGYRLISECAFRQHTKFKKSDELMERYREEYFALIKHYRNKYHRMVEEDKTRRVLAANAPFTSCQL
jgi:hypothetical protein